jgi:hypothetical protein
MSRPGGHGEGAFPERGASAPSGRPPRAGEPLKRDLRLGWYPSGRTGVR